MGSTLRFPAPPPLVLVPGAPVFAWTIKGWIREPEPLDLGPEGLGSPERAEGLDVRGIGVGRVRGPEKAED